MNGQPTTFDTFVEKIVLHNRLVAQERLGQAKASVIQHPGMSLLQVLVNARLVSQKHSEIIHQKFQEYSALHGISDDSGKTSESAVAQIHSDEGSGTPALPPEQHPQDESSQEAQTETGVAPSNQDETSRENEDAPKPDEPVEESESRISGGGPSLKDLLIQSRNKGASDLHINVNSPPMMRKHGNLMPLDQGVLRAEDTERLLFRVLEDKEQSELRQDQVLDTCLTIDGLRYRGCSTKQQFGWEGSFRIIGETIPTMEGLGLPEELERLTEFREGIVLITGPSGSGKSTTLAAFIEHINECRNEHIITLEEPVEFIFPPKKSHISQREVGLHTSSYSMALRAALREDPDVIVVGELRDRETTSLAVTAAETGHLVFATLHTTSAAQTIYRLLDFFPPDQRNQIRAQVSESLRGILCQRLIPRKDGQGMVMALEVMINVTSIANLIREDRIFQLPNMMQINTKYGMRLLDDSIHALVESKLIDEEDAYFASDNRERFKQWAPSIESPGIAESVYGEH